MLFFNSVSKAYKSKGLYFIVCLCLITLSNLLECWLCENVNLFLLWISRTFGTRWQCMTAFSEKNIEIRYILIAKTRKVSSKSWAKQEGYCTAKTFSCNRWTAMWFASAPKMTSQTKKPYFNPWMFIWTDSTSSTSIFSRKVYLLFW